MSSSMVVRSAWHRSKSTCSRATIAFVAILAVGLGVGAGVYSGIDRAGLDADRANGRLDNTDPRIDRGAAFSGVADGAFGVAAIIGAIGIFLFAYSPGPPSIAHVGRRH